MQAHFDLVQKRLRREGTLVPLMKEVLDREAAHWIPGDAKRPPDWDALRTLDYAAERERFTAYTMERFSHEAPRAEINGILFTLFYPSMDASHEQVGVVIRGSKRFPEGEWYRDNDYPVDDEVPVYDSPVLRAIYRKIHLDAGGYIPARARAIGVCTALICLCTAEWFDTPAMREMLQGDAPGRGIAVWDGVLRFHVGILGELPG